MTRLALLLPLLALGAGGLAVAASSGDAAVENVVWKKRPIHLSLAVGRDRAVRFPTAVKVGAPAKLSDTLIAKPVDNTVFWRATGAFEETLVLVQALDGHETYTLYLEAHEAQSEDTAAAGPVRIWAPASAGAGDDGDGNRSGSGSGARSRSAPKPAPRGHGYIALTRFAAQQLYAPARALEGLPGVHRVPLEYHEPVELLTGVFLDPSTGEAVGANVRAVPLIAWADATGTTVTAVRLTNRSGHAVMLDPRTALRGDWLTATFQHAYLRAAGKPGDTTAVYVTATRRFSEALRPFARVRRARPSDDKSLQPVSHTGQETE